MHHHYCLILILTLLSCGGTSDEEDDKNLPTPPPIATGNPADTEANETPAPTDSAKQTPDVPPAVTPTAKPFAIANFTQNFGGFGSKVIEIDLAAGAAIFRVSSSAPEEYFGVTLNQNGDFVGLIANLVTAENYKATTIQEIKNRGKYVADIDSAGAWRLDILAPKVGDMPKKVEGDSSTVSDVFFVDRAMTIKVTATYSGDSNFIVGLQNEFGGFADLAFNEIGAITNSESAINVREAGWYFIQVEAEGSYSVAIQPL